MNRENQKIEEKLLEQRLRPTNFDEYIGQENIKKNLKIIIEAAKKRKEPIEHLLFYGSSGLGKTTLSLIIARELNKKIHSITGPNIERVGDVASILTNLREGEILFIDEIHRLNRLIEESLYPAMEDFKLNIILGKGPMARTMEIKLSRFTIIGATTRIGLLNSAFRNRFGGIFQINFYNTKEIEKIIERSVRILNLEIEKSAIRLIAKRSRFIPRVANRILRRVRDFAQVCNKKIITEDITKETLKMFEIDEKGLELGDRKILETIILKFNGGPVGLQSLAAACLEEEDTILEIYEPYLLQIGFLERTSKGRMATYLAYQHLKKVNPCSQKLF